MSAVNDLVKGKELLKIILHRDYDKPGAFAKAQKIVRPLLPKRLFKFRGFTDGALNNLKENTLFCAKPKTFNDPFDCGLTLRGPDERTVYVKALIALGCKDEGQLMEVNKAVDPYAAFIQIVERQTDHVGRLDSKEFRERMAHAFFEPVQLLNDKMRDSCNICSLSERVNSLPMWAHYGDDHCGFAMEYDFHKLDSRSKLRSSIWPVLYEEKRYDVTEQIFGRPVRAFNELFVLGGALCKSVDWQYEREWRIVKIVESDTPASNVRVPKPVALYIGSDMSMGNSEILKKEAKRKNIPIFRMELSKNTFEMVAVPF